MALETDLNKAPFWDDYDENKDFYRILFRPGVPVQARELTQSQTILANQIEKFGQNIYKDGTIISGANFTFDAPLPYIKVADLQTDGQPVNAAMYEGAVIKNSSNLTAIVQTTVDGLESQNPNLNTLYIKYVNKGVDGNGTYSNSEVVSAFSKEYGILSVEVADGGSGYSNTDIVKFTSADGDGAAGRIVTAQTGSITNVVMTSRGSGYLTLPTVSVANSSGGASSGAGAQLLANNIIGQLTVAANTFAQAGNTEFNTVGNGYGFKVGEGVLFQKGTFLRIEPQSIIVSKYSVRPTETHVGFNTIESVVNNSIDTSLLDNAQGSPNENSPGAYRLRMVPRLVTMKDSEVKEAKNFFSLVEFQEGRAVKQHQSPQFNSLGSEMAKRTAEESGDYVLQPFSIISDDIAGNTTHIQARIGAGTAYVGGFRVHQYDTYSVPVRRGTDVQQLGNVSLSTNYGSYVIVTGVGGTIPINTSGTIDLRTTGATKIGTARARNLVYHSDNGGDITYRLYIFDIRMNSGKKFDDTKTIHFAAGGGLDGQATLVLEQGKAVLKEANFAPMIFRFGQKAVKTLRGPGNSNDTSYIYTTMDTGVNFASANGFMQKNLTGGDVFPYSGPLNDVEERDFIFIARNSANTTPLAGTVSMTTGNTTVTGSGTQFLADYAVGDWMAPTGGQSRKIASIANNTSLTLSANPSAGVSSVNHARHYPANEVIPFTNRPNRTISATGAVMQANLGTALTNNLNVNLVYNVQRNGVLQLTKNINKNIFVRLSLGTHPASTNGPWCLGLTDVQRIVRVEMRTGSHTAPAFTDVTSHFTLDNGQKDTHYGLAYMRKKPTSKLVFPANAFLAVIVDVFTHTDTGGGIGFFSIDSYPVDDVTIPTPANAITTQDIPVYTSPVSGSAYDLRDAADFRQAVNRTANVATTSATASTNPSASEVFSGTDKYVPAVNRTMATSLQYYQGRYDIIALTSYGQYTVKEGVPSDVPVVPSKVNGAMNLATVSVPPYPTLPTRVGGAANRPDYTVKISTKQNRRYTMEDIGSIDRRLDRVEYYTALTLLEKQTSDLLIPSSGDPNLNRFKNGIFVDPFANFNLGNILDGEFTAGIDEAVGELIPRFDQDKFDLVPTTLNNVVINKQIGTMGFTSKAVVMQPYGTRVRNCAENFWNYNGHVELVPSYDNYYDVKKSPENTIVIDVDTASSTLSLIDELNKMKALNTVDTTTTSTSSSELVSSSVRGGDSSVSHWVDETYSTVTTTTTTETKNMMVGQVSETVSKVGDFITDISFSPYIRASIVRFKVTGLKPNTQVNAFFDKVLVTGYCQEAKFVASTNYEDSWKTTKALGAGLMSNAQGELYGLLCIPAQTFFVGDRELKFLDINNLNSESAASTSASTMYRAYNFSVSKSDVVVSTRAVEVSTNSSTSSSTTTNRDTSNRETFVEVPTPPPPPVIPQPPVSNFPNIPEVDFGGWSWNRGVDPIAQTFQVSREMTDNQDGMFVSRVDLFFARKDPNVGVTVQIRATNNGYPAAQIMPMGSVHLRSEQISVSANAAAATPVHFESPVFLRSGQEYCIVVLPDGNSPEYLIYTAQGGQTDLTNINYTVRKDWGMGMLFTSTNNSAWQSIQDEDMKFVIYRAVFNTGQARIDLTNKDDEYLNVSDIEGTFLAGEKVFKVAPAVPGTVSFNVNSVQVTGTGTSFQSSFVNGQYLVLASGTPSANTKYEVLQVVNVANNTSMTLDATPKFTSTTGVILKTPVAEIYSFDPQGGEMVLTNSTAANTSFYFSANDDLVGVALGGKTKILGVDNKVISYFQPLIYRTAMSGTEITGNIRLSNQALQLQPAVPIRFNDSNYITTFEAYVASKSNEIRAGTGKSVRATLNLSSRSNLITPTVDFQSCSILKYENLINNSLVGEDTSNGEAISKYVSKTVTLKEGLDAEDIKVMVTGYQPAGTEIAVYVRALADADPDNLRDKAWTKLVATANTTCDTANRNDFREFEYIVRDDVDSEPLTGVVSGANSAVTITGVDTLFNSELVAGDVIKIGFGVNEFVTKVVSIEDDTGITIVDELPMAYVGASIAKLSAPKALFRDKQNDGVLSYYGNQSRYDSYKTFAVKVSLISESTNIVPRLKDLSAIALSI